MKLCTIFWRKKRSKGINPRSEDDDISRNPLEERLSFRTGKSPKKNDVWEVNNEDDLGLDLGSSNSKSKRRHTKPDPVSGGPQVDLFDASNNRASFASLNRASYSSKSSNRSSLYSSNGERIPPPSPVNVPHHDEARRSTVRSHTSSERSSIRRSIQLIPRSMINPQSPPLQSDDLRRIEQELLAIGAKERLSRGASSSDADRSEYLATRSVASLSDSERPRSETSGSSRGVRIQYVPRRSLEDADQVSRDIHIPPAVTSGKIRGRINRSLTAVTEEETRINSEYHDEEDDD